MQRVDVDITTSAGHFEPMSNNTRDLGSATNTSLAQRLYQRP